MSWRKINQYTFYQKALRMLKYFKVFVKTISEIFALVCHKQYSVLHLQLIREKSLKLKLQLNLFDLPDHKNEQSA